MQKWGNVKMGVFQPPVDERNRNLARRVCATLLANGYRSAEYAETAEDAARMALTLIPDGVSVGIPGTVTLRELGLPDKLAEKNCTVYHHWDPKLTAADKGKRLLEENLADWFVTSSNAMTQDGKMVNIDGTGNRVAAMAWAPGKILYIVSVDKIARNTDSAIARARDLATPPNAVRTGWNAPCTKTGHCVDCNSPERVCRVVTIMERVPLGREAHVILVGEHLGY